MLSGPCLLSVEQEEGEDAAPDADSPAVVGPSSPSEEGPDQEAEEAGLSIGQALPQPALLR